mmetsp:Transcript_90116/g.162531  ORF Transcript_90116/g.162531 Transcript_90116/m.162531 type:complete len:93 (-) Transcript_90116:80-358(-)
MAGRRTELPLGSDALSNSTIEPLTEAVVEHPDPRPTDLWQQEELADGVETFDLSALSSSIKPASSPSEPPPPGHLKDEAAARASRAGYPLSP